MLKCDYIMCDKEAVYARNLPYVGDSLCVCEKHMKEDKYTAEFYVMTEEDKQNEIQAEKAFQDFLRQRLSM